MPVLVAFLDRVVDLRTLVLVAFRGEIEPLFLMPSVAEASWEVSPCATTSFKFYE
jgi:hypothetical protein